MKPKSNPEYIRSNFFLKYGTKRDNVTVKYHLLLVLYNNFSKKNVMKKKRNFKRMKTRIKRMI
jgi:hypothetical protein